LERVYRLHSNKDTDNEEAENDDVEGEASNKKSRDDPKAKQKRVSLYTKLSLVINVVSIEHLISFRIVESRIVDVLVSTHNKNCRCGYIAFFICDFISCRQWC
jgi:hypothetical protein